MSSSSFLNLELRDRLLPGRHQPLIVVFGATGCGKSSFINSVIGRDVAPVGHAVDSQTRKIEEYKFSLQGQQAILVDTPGIGYYSQESDISEVEILGMVGEFLLNKYQAGRKFTAIIYIHDINEPSVSRISHTQMQIFKGLCGVQSMKNVVVVTTFWDRLRNAQEGIARENELQNVDQFLKPLYVQGALFKRVGKQGAGQQLVEEYNLSMPREIILNFSPPQTVYVAMQKELAIFKNVASTTAAKALQSFYGFKSEEHLVKLETLTGNIQALRGETHSHGISQPITAEQAKSEGLIIVIGNTASGKSSFINDVLAHDHYSNSEPAPLGHGYKTMTTQTKEYRTTINNLSVTLLDTPPFDAKLWKELRKAYLEVNNPQRITFVVFLYDITKNRLGKDLSNHMSLLMGSKNVVLVTTFWDRLDSHSEGTMRENYLKSQYDIFQQAGHLGRDEQQQPSPDYLNPFCFVANILLTPSNSDSVQAGKTLKRSNESDSEENINTQEEFSQETHIPQNGLEMERRGLIPHAIWGRMSNISKRRLSPFQSISRAHTSSDSES